MGNLKEIDFYKKALMLSEKVNDAWGVRWAFYQIGIFQNANKDATSWLYKAVKAAEKAHDSLLLSSSFGYRALAGIYSYMGNSNEAVKCAQKSITYCPEGLKNKEYYANALTYLAYFLVTNNQFNKADSIFDIAWLKISQNNLVSILITYYNGRSELESKRGNHGKAIQMLLKSNDIIDSLKQEGLGLDVYNNFTIAEYILKADKHQLAIAGIKESDKYNEAIKYANRSLKDAIPLNFQDAIIESYKYLSEANEGKGNIAEAFRYYKMSIAVKDSLYNSEDYKTIQELKTAYETEKKEQQIALLNKDKALQLEKIEKQKTTRNAFISGFVLVALLAGVSYNRYRVKQQANREIENTLTNLKNSQEQLVQQGKLAALGKMTAEVAAEIQHPLNEVKILSSENESLADAYINAKTETERNQILDKLEINFESINKNGKMADGIVKNVLMQSRR